MPKITDFYLDALAHFLDKVSHAGLKYVRRTERYEVLADYSLRATRDLQLRATAEAPIQYVETSWSSEIAAPFEEIGFEVELSTPNVAFVLPIVDRATADDGRTLVREVKVVLGFSTPLKKGDLAELRMRWTWPRYWSALRSHGKDSVAVAHEREVGDLQVSVCAHRSIAQSIATTVNAPAISTTTLADAEFCGQTWCFARQAPGQRLRFSLAASRRGSENPEALSMARAHPPATPANRTKIFISYARKDEPWLNQLRDHLNSIPAVRQSFLIWDDSKILPGQTWAEAIEAALASARVAILLVSPAFLVSEFINTEELPAILDRAEKSLTVLPLVVRACSVDSHPLLSRYQFLYPGSKPLAGLKLAKRDAVLAKIASDVASRFADG